MKEAVKKDAPSIIQVPFFLTNRVSVFAEASIGGAKSSNQFKDRLREQGGLSTICHLAASCQASLRDDVIGSSGDVIDGESDVSKGSAAAQATMLLRCLRVLEHVTYVSEENQRHLLELQLTGRGVEGRENGRGRKGGPENVERGADTCIGVVLGCIEALAPANGEGQVLSEMKGIKEEAPKGVKAKRLESDVDAVKKGTEKSGDELPKVRRGNSTGRERPTREKEAQPKESMEGNAKPDGKWQSASKPRGATSRSFRGDEVIPDSDEEIDLLEETKGLKVNRDVKGRPERTGGRPGEGQVAAGKNIQLVGRRTSGRFAKAGSGVRMSEEETNMDIVRDSASEKAVSSDDVIDPTGQGLPPIIRTFSRKKRKTESSAGPGCNAGGGSGEGVSGGENGSKSNGGRGLQVSDPFDFDDAEMEDLQKLSSQNSGQFKGKRKLLARSKTGAEAASQEQPSISKPMSEERDGDSRGGMAKGEQLEKRSSWKGKREAAKSSANLPPKAPSAFDFDFVEEPEAPSAGPSGRGLEKRGPGVVSETSKKVKQGKLEKTAFDFDDFEEETDGACPRKKEADDGRGQAATMQVQNRVRDRKALKRDDSGAAQVPFNETKPSEAAPLRKSQQPPARKAAVASAFAFKPAAEERERKGLGSVEENRDEEGQRREVHLELDKALVTECLVTSVKVRPCYWMRVANFFLVRAPKSWAYITL
jgi:hypothetical protein